MAEMNVTTMYYTRPDTNTSWGPLIRPPHIQEHYNTNYIDSGHLVKEETTISDDGLVFTRKMAWLISPDIFEKYKNDVVIQNYLIEVRQYNQTHGIIPSVTPAAFAAAQTLLQAGKMVNPFRKIYSIDEF